MVFPTKVIEYLVRGLAVVTTVRGEAGELLEAAQAGYAVAPEDPAALADVLARLGQAAETVASLKRNAAKLAPTLRPEKQVAVIAEMAVEIARNSSRRSRASVGI